jgi:hypothetical protein
VSAGDPSPDRPIVRAPAPGEPVLTVRDGVIVRYCHGDGLGTVVVGSSRLRFRGSNAAPDVRFQIGEPVRCWVLRSGFVQRLERKS